MDPDLQTTHRKLRALRERTDLNLKPCPLLRKTFLDEMTGEEKDFGLRYYQVQMVFHMLAMRNFVCGDDTGLGKCVTKDTLIETERGLVPIGSLQPTPDMMPDTFEPVDGWKVRIGDDLAPIKSFYYSGHKPTRRVRTRYGFEVEGSLVHPLYVRGGGHEDWRKTSEIGVGDHLCVDRGGMFPDEEPSLMVPVVGSQVAANAKSYPVSDHMNPALARLLGYIVGEGWVNNRYTFHVHQSREVNPETHRDIRNLLVEVFGREVADNDTMLVHSAFLRSYLEYMGVDYTTSHDKRVPEAILRATRDSTREFLRGLFEGEGSAIPGGIEFSTASEQLGKEVQLLLLRFGIVANRSPRTVEGYDHTYWRLTLFGDDARLFDQEIGFVSSRKQERLAGLLPDDSNPNHDVVPHTVELVEGLRGALSEKCKALRWQISQKWGSSFYNTLGHIRHGRRNPTYRFLREFLSICRETDLALTQKEHSWAPHLPHLPLLQDHGAYKAIEALVSRRFFYDPVVEVIEGFKEVVDIEVDNPRHSFVGNGLVNHNTIETIASLCYLWSLPQHRDRKAIVLAKKAAVKQWAKAFNTFTDGVQVIVSKGTKAQRRKAYAKYEAAQGPTVLISGYRSMVNDISQVQDWEGFVFVTDECFQYHTPVVLADGTTELIGKIVTKRMPVEVLSWNPDTGQVEPKRVVHWHRNPLRKGRRKNLLSISFRFGGNVRVTRTHKFYSPDGRGVPAGTLRKGSEVGHLCTSIPSEHQWQVILGGLLGDSSISHPQRPRWGVGFGHSEKQEDYLRFKRELLATLGVSEVDTTPNTGFPRQGGEEKGYARFRLNANAAVTSFLIGARVRRGGKKRVTLDWLDRIDPLGLAVWYADDGSLNEHTCSDGTTARRITLNTQGFTREEVELLAGWLRWKWGVDAEVKVSKPRADRSGSQRRACPHIYLAAEAADRFLDLLPCGFPGVMHKFPGKFIATLTSFDLTPRQGIVTDWMTEKRAWTPPEKERYVYDLEVEDNHNYFANGTLVSNCTVYKNPGTQVHQVCKHMSSQANRIWALTATLIKNNLLEGFGIMQVVVPGLFTHTQTAFLNDYCITRLQPIRGGRHVPVLVGYRPQDIERFKAKIDPYYLGRPKHDVADELPVLTMRNIEVGMTSFQKKLYQDALDGLLEKGDGEEKETDKLTALIYCQQIVNHPALLDYEDSSSEKLDALIDMVTEGGDLDGDKVIVYTRFKKLVDYAIPVMEKKGIKCVRVTGAETEDQRQEAMDTFQNFKSGTNVIWITDAGGDSINLQAAKALVFFDCPWSAGDYLQVIGRMIRIGSIHDRVYALHLVVKGTIDMRVQEVKNKKMKLIEAVLGARIKGTKEPDQVIHVESERQELYDYLLEDARSRRIS